VNLKSRYLFRTIWQAGLKVNPGWEPPGSALNMCTKARGPRDPVRDPGREVLQQIELPPPEYSRREVAALLLQCATPAQLRI